MDRRSFIYSSSIISTATIVGAKSIAHKLTSTPPGVGFYMARSGNFKNDEFYLLSIFEIENPEIISAQLESIKSAHNYRTKISYNVNDKFKIPVAKEMIDLFIKKNIKATSLLELSSNQGGSSSSHQVKINAIQRILGNNFQSDLIAKNESYYSPSTQMRENFHTAVGGQLVNERTDQTLLLQFTDLINGCIFGAIHRQVQNPTKLELINYFKNEIGIYSFEKGTEKENKLQII